MPDIKELTELQQRTQGASQDGIGGFALAPPGAFPTHLSDVYYKLYEYVEAKFHDRPPTIRRLIFALAYTKYSREKKYDSFVVANDGAQNGDPRLTRIHVQFCTEMAFEQYCHVAQLIIESAIEEIGVTALTVGLTRVSGFVEGLVKSYEKWSWARFFKEAGLHTIVLIFLAVFFIAVSFAFPFIRGALDWIWRLAHIPDLLDAVHGH